MCFLPFFTLVSIRCLMAEATLLVIVLSAIAFETFTKALIGLPIPHLLITGVKYHQNLNDPVCIT